MSLAIYSAFSPPPLDDEEILQGLRARGYTLGDPASINWRPMYQINGVFVEPWHAYYLAVGKATFDEVLDASNTVVPKT